MIQENRDHPKAAPNVGGLAERYMLAALMVSVVGSVPTVLLILKGLLRRPMLLVHRPQGNKLVAKELQGTQLATTATAKGELRLRRSLRYQWTAGGKMGQVRLTWWWLRLRSDLIDRRYLAMPVMSSAAPKAT